jgi:hypothetical protein
LYIFKNLSGLGAQYKLKYKTMAAKENGSIFSRNLSNRIAMFYSII